MFNRYTSHLVIALLFILPDALSAQNAGIRLSNRTPVGLKISSPAPESKPIPSSPKKQDIPPVPKNGDMPAKETKKEEGIALDLDEKPQKTNDKIPSEGKKQRNLTTKTYYTTLESIECDYISVKKYKKINILQQTINDLALDAKSKTPTLSPEKIRKQRDSITKVSLEINLLQQLEDSLTFIYTKDYLSFRPVFCFNFNALRSRAFFDLIYANEGTRFKALSNTGINLGGNTASLYSEIVSGNLGLFRVSLGTMISNSRQDSTQYPYLPQQSEAYQRLVTYGGNTVLNIEYPLLYLHADNSQYNLIGRFIVKGTADFPAFGTNTTSWAGSSSAGIDLYGDAALNNDKLRFFFNANANAIIGTEQFVKNLGIKHDKFLFGQVSVGLVFLQNYKLSLIIYTMSTEAVLQNRAVIAGGQVLR
jgi:hypothetical protein